MRRWRTRLDGWAGFPSAVLMSTGNLWRSSMFHSTILSPTNSRMPSATGRQCGSMRRTRSILQSGSGGLWTGFDSSLTISYETCLIVSTSAALSAAPPNRILAPLHASQPTPEVPATPQPSHPTLSTDAPSSGLSAAGTASPSVGPSLSTGPIHPALGIRSPTAHSSTLPASNPRTAPDVSSTNSNDQSAAGGSYSPLDPSRREPPTPSDASLETPTSPSTPSNSRVRDTATPVQTPSKQLPILTTPSTPSSSRSRDLATLVETPSKRPPVQFGSAPDRVLTTAPPKRKASHRRGGTTLRRPARTKLRAA